MHRNKHMLISEGLTHSLILLHNAYNGSFIFGFPCALQGNDLIPPLHTLVKNGVLVPCQSSQSSPLLSWDFQMEGGLIASCIG